MSQTSPSFKNIEPVPSGTEFLDIVLSRTQRRLPTVIRPGFKISRIRAFYARKVKYTQESFSEKLEAILTQFPRLDAIHPFHADLFNVLYDKEHYKIALGQLSTAKHLIENVSRDYLRLMKFGDSLYRCKQLKRAALGRMAGIIKRQTDPLAYLEQVRQHLARLPSIEVNTRTLILAGYPNVGKSSFMNKITRADVDVQPYAFTTKSLFVGHMDYKYLRWQVIDTPGILDHPLEEMNTIEMQSVTALAHLRACVLYFMDLSGECGYSVAQQTQLFHNIRPLFANKVTFVAINKIDRARPEDLDSESQALLQSIFADGTVEKLELSCATEDGVMDARNSACDRLLAARVDAKLKGTRINDVLHKIHLATPMPRDDVPRLPFIPDQVRNRRLYDWNDPERPKLEKDLEADAGGAGRYSIDLKSLISFDDVADDAENYLLEDEEWKKDILPEFLNGQNVYDFIDPDIEAKLNALEEEEERLEAEGFYDSDDEILDDEEAETLEKADSIRTRITLQKNESRLNKKALKNRAIIPRTKVRRRFSQLEKHLSSLGLDHSSISGRARSGILNGDIAMSGEDVVMRDAVESAPSEAQIWKAKASRATAGLKNSGAVSKVERLTKAGQVKRNREGRRGDADRRLSASKPKHMLVGKRKVGKTNRR